VQAAAESTSLQSMDNDYAVGVCVLTVLAALALVSEKETVETLKHSQCRKD